MQASERIEMNRRRAKEQRRADRAVEWALVESFGMAGFKAAYERCLQSERFPALCSLAVNTPQHSDTWPQVVAFAKTLANNPRSRSNAYRKAVRGCGHAEVSLATTSDPDTVCADCGEILQHSSTPALTQTGKQSTLHTPAARCSREQISKGLRR